MCIGHKRHVAGEVDADDVQRICWNLGICLRFLDAGHVRSLEKEASDRLNPVLDEPHAAGLAEHLITVRRAQQHNSTSQLYVHVSAAPILITRAST